IRTPPREMRRNSIGEEKHVRGLRCRTGVGMDLRPRSRTGITGLEDRPTSGLIDLSAAASPARTLLTGRIPPPPASHRPVPFILTMFNLYKLSPPAMLYSKFAMEVGIHGDVDPVSAPGFPARFRFGGAAVRNDQVHLACVLGGVYSGLV